MSKKELTMDKTPTAEDFKRVRKLYSRLRLRISFLEKRWI